MSKRHRSQRKGEEPASQSEGLWVLSDRMPDGTYAVSITWEGDTSWVLDRAGALEYARTAVEAAQRAEFDAAVFKLFTRKLKMPPGLAVEVIALELRPDRPPLNDEATAPLAFVPGVNPHGKPFIHVQLKGEMVGQLDVDQLRRHAMTVLEAPAAADLDNGLLTMVKKMDIDESVGRAVIDDLSRWRD